LLWDEEASAAKAKSARIGRLAVLPACRGQGVGSRLLRLLEQAALAGGAQQVALHAQVQAQDFYRRHQYRVDGAGTIFYEDGIAHVRMCKTLW
jgi:predicted GNAT family N-acyltransferase